MKKIIRLTESDLTNIVKRVIKESAAKDSLIDMIKYDGWESAAELVGGDENLAKLAFNNEPMNFLHMFDDLDVVKSEEKPNWILYRYEKRNNMMIYNKKNDEVYINYSKIWQFLEESFGLDFNEIQEVMKEWLFEVYNLRGVTPQIENLRLHRALF
jgi:hypothetical protein